MDRTLPLLAAALVVLCFVPTGSGAERIESRHYVLGPGLRLALPLCPSFAVPFEVCFTLNSDDSAIEYTIVNDHASPFPVAGTAWFEDAAGLPMTNATSFCGSSPEYAIPPGATMARVIVGPLANVSLIPGCVTGVGTIGAVEAHIV